MTKGRWVATILLAVLLTAESVPAATVVINEFLAANDSGLKDGDGDYSDWIELWNAGSTNVNLGGWQLRDSSDRWTFPNVTLAANKYLVVFASEKNRAVAGSQLHTNFKLTSEGEHLSLVDLEGVYVSKFAPAFPPQAPDISYGIGTEAAVTTLLPAGAACSWHVPADGSVDAAWMQPDGFSETGWTAGTTGVGYERETGYESLIGADVGSAMYNLSGTVYVRIHFTVADPSAFDTLALKMKYDDGFVAYLNGAEVARANAPAAPVWNSEASAGHDDAEAVVFVAFDITDQKRLLRVGDNVLAVHGLNAGVGSSDFLMVPELEATGGAAATWMYRYFNTPTPGAANGAGTADLGPIIKDVAHTPRVPEDADDITVTARLVDTGDGIASVKLYYRVMLGSESNRALYDDGAHGDGAAGDGIYGGAIPASASGKGQMVRYYIRATDGAGHASRFPVDDDTIDYLGTVVNDPGVSSPLPVYHVFVQNPDWYWSWVDGAKVYNKDWQAGCFFWNGVFVDNMRIRARGRTTLGNTSRPRKKMKIVFPKGHYVQFAAGDPPAREINLNTDVPHEVMAYESFRDAGTPCSLCYPVRIQMNGAFFGLRSHLEEVDKRFLERHGLDPDGAMYRPSWNFLTDLNTFEKVTREDEDFSDLQALIDGLKLSGTALDNYLYDNINIPQLINYLAVAVVLTHGDRCPQNYYLYRDSDGNREWSLFPWDLNDCFITNSIYCPETCEHPLYGSYGYSCNTTPYSSAYNRLYDRLLNTASTREMYFRRLRNLMDRMLQPPYYEDRLSYWHPFIWADGDLDIAKWGQKNWLFTGYRFSEDKVEIYLPHRRKYLYNHSLVPAAEPASPALNIGTIECNPASQDQDEEYIQLTNPNGYAVDLSGWRLANAVEHTFQPGTVIPAGGSLYVSPDVRAFRARATSPKGGEGRFVQGDYDGQLSAWGETVELYDAGGRLVKSKTYAGNPSAAQQYLRISEIHYNPDRNEEYEFIELKNTRSSSLDISGVAFTDGIAFTFPGGTSLAAGEYLVLVRNLASFRALYGTGPRVGGTYAGNLDNGGEHLELRDKAGEKILSFEYKDGWYPATDAVGQSLVMTELAPHDREHWDNAANWRASYAYGGSPGADDVDAGIVINEVLTHSDAPLEDAIELYNTSGASVDIGGWYLSDDAGNLKKYRIPSGTVVGAHGYKVFYEYQFNQTPGSASCFALSSHGDDLWLCQADASGNLKGYRAYVDFGPAENGVSFGGYVCGDGRVDFTAMSARTFGVDNPGSLTQFRTGTGKANSAPKLGPVVINELMYHPEDGGHEFIELCNSAAATVPLYDTAYPANTWRLTGAVDYIFPGGVTLGAGEYVLVVPLAPAEFRTLYGIPAGTRIFGPYIGALDNAGESLSLRKPDPPDPEWGVAYVRVDRVAYDNKAPWPEGADGAGPSLERRSAGAYGNEPASWQASAAAGGSPGRANGSGQAAAPLAPANFAAVAVSSTRIDLSWTHDGQNVENFKIRWGLSEAAVNDNPVEVPASARRYSHSGLEPGTTYYYTIKAENDAAGDSPYLSPIAQTTRAEAQPQLTVSTTDIQVSCAEGRDAADATFQVWNAGTGTLAYKIVEGTSKFDIAPATGTSTGSTDKKTHTVGFYTAGLAAGVYDRDFTVEDNGSGAPNGPLTVNVRITITAQPPAAPANLLAMPVSASRIDLSWTDASDTEDGFKIDRRESGTSEWVRIATPGAGATRYSDTGLQAATHFYYMVKAWNGTGNSPYSDVAAATTLSNAAEPVELVGRGAVWRYRKGTAEPPAGWRRPDFDDAAWAAGPAPLGYGAAGLATTLDDMCGSYTTVYLRRMFACDAPALVRELRLSAEYDDGFVIWLNGEELARVNVDGAPGTFVPHDALALGPVQATWSNAWSGAAMPALRVGQNVLAVHMLNRSAGSSDLLLDLELVAEPGMLDAGEDADQDALPDAWEQAFSADLSDSADPDGDGLSNLEEWIAGGDPTETDSCLSVDLGIRAGRIVVSFPTIPAAGPGYEGRTRHYALEVCPDLGGLQSGGWLPVAGYADIVGDGDTVAYTNAAPGGMSSYRARVWLTTP
ncbi:MAG: lamin tail domain-containing protein [Kiritimatiellae bacterium]|nr:lamin tail domain-containing protein [Kiritimatiellia bacterium]